MASTGVLCNLISRVSSLTIRNLSLSADVATSRSFKTWCHPLCFQMTPVVCGEPLKKKKRVDPAILRRREERKRKRLEKDIRKLQRNAQKLKPIEESEISKTLLLELNKRRRRPVQLSFEEAENRAKQQKEWCQYRTQQHVAETNMISRIMGSQERALSKLRDTSEELYQAAIEIDDNLIPFKTKGPVALLAVEGYEPPTGVYIDTTRKWDKKIDLPVMKKKKSQPR